MPSNVHKAQPAVIAWTLGVCLAIFVAVMMLLYVVKVEGRILAPAGVLGGPGLLAAAAALVGVYRTARIRSLPVVKPDAISAHAGRRIMVAGYAFGATVTSRWSGRPCVYTEAERVRTTTDSDVHGNRRTRRDWDHIGSQGALALTGAAGGTGAVELTPDTFTLLHLPQTTPEGDVTSTLRSAMQPNGAIRETLIAAGTPLWVCAVIADDGRGVNNDEWTQVSGADPAGQTRFLVKVVAVSAVISAGLLAMMAVVIAAG